MGVVGGHRDRRHQRPLPKILIIDLGNRHVEFVPQPILQALDYVPLVFQRVRILDSYFQRQYTNCRHLREELSSHLLGCERLENIALLHISEVVERHAALHATLDFGHIVLEPA